MKRKDISVIIAIVFLTGLVSFWVSNALFNKARTTKDEVEIVQPITSDFIKPEQKYFNGNSINPTQTIIVGETTNPDPF